MDPTTQSNYSDVVSQHVHFDWIVDFQAKIISGSATHTILVRKDDIKEVIFDTSDLNVYGARISGDAVLYRSGSKHAVMGTALHVSLPVGIKKDTVLQIVIDYTTTEDCTALQWLSEEQTQGKQFPYLFSQCQPIYARALAPLQDTPSAKVTYSANVTSTLPVLLSAIRRSPASDGPAHDGKEIGRDPVVYTYEQPIPIPSYLIAIASGNVRYRPFPKYENKEWSSGIWAEPELIDKAYWEFSEDTARFLAAEEKIVAPYEFGVYDLLVLPPAFPYGGMENACLTFLTPTLLAGDRTLVDVVVHELTHSFFGNGVTHAHASHFWLNEGWTTYIERVLQEILHSPAERGFQFIIGSKALRDSLKQYEDRPKYQRLVIKFEKGEDPDDAYSSIPYEKGANFLLYLERILGGLEEFLPYVKDYVGTFMGQSITTGQWKDHLYEYYKTHGSPENIKALDDVDWNAWFYGEGLELPVLLTYDTTLATVAYNLAERWNVARSTDTSKLDFRETDLDDFNGNQIIVFLEHLQSYEPLPSSLVTHLGSLYKLSLSLNTEIRFRFYQVALSDPSSSVAKSFAKPIAKWVVGEDETGVIKGRMKFCRPTFRALLKVNKALTEETFNKSKNAFHPIARKLIEKDLGLV
ncbi:peptidase family M1-domain-containing protein [Cyathus striatus]|nr:peptidase family M1-domain-containing protein [Cyathus striatus]